jgi:hypothetical protein
MWNHARRNLVRLGDVVRHGLRTVVLESEGLLDSKAGLEQDVLEAVRAELSAA